MARVALVTGGTRGIGHAISIALKSAGYRVAASYAGNDTAAHARLGGKDRRVHPFAGLVAETGGGHRGSSPPAAIRAAPTDGL